MTKWTRDGIGFRAIDGRAIMTVKAIDPVVNMYGYPSPRAAWTIVVDGAEVQRGIGGGGTQAFAFGDAKHAATVAARRYR